MKLNSFQGAFLLSAVLLSAGPGRAPTPPATNPVPSVRIVTPSDGTLLLAPLNLHLGAVAAGFTNQVASVEFFAGTNLVGVATNGTSGTGVGEPAEPAGSFFGLTWSNVPPGAYALTVTATDLAGNSATSAAVDISVVTNLPPRVVITKPANGATILGPTNLTLAATAFDPDNGTVTQVEFFEGATSLGVVTNMPATYVTNRHEVVRVKNTSFRLAWNGVAPGAYTLTAVATDNDGATTTSQPVGIAVVTNLPPRVRIESPGEVTAYYAPGTIGICALASAPGGTVTSVEFFSGTNSLGLVTNGTSVTNHEGIYSQYCFTWSGVASGTYSVTAVATDSTGATGASAPVSITVVPLPPPSLKVSTSGDRYVAPANIWIYSTPRHFPDSVAAVQYFAGSNSLGVSTNPPSFWFQWTNVPAGVYTLTATATDVAGTNTVTSPAVSVSVTTNRPSGGRH